MRIFGWQTIMISLGGDFKTIYRFIFSTFLCIWMGTGEKLTLDVICGQEDRSPNKECG
jgi:hypothetical protein